MSSFGIALKGPPPSIKDVWSYRDMKKWVSKLPAYQLDEPVLLTPGDGTVIAMKRPVIENEFGVHGEVLKIPTKELKVDEAWWEDFKFSKTVKKKKKAKKAKKKTKKKKKKVVVAPSVARRKKKKKKVC